MNILIIGPFAPHGQVGAIRMISLSRFLIQHGHKVTTLCLSEQTLMKMDPQGLTAKTPSGVEEFHYDVTLSCSSLMKKNIINENECCTALNQLLAGKSFDVAIISAGPFYQFKCSKTLKSHRIPFIVDYRDLHLSSKDKRKRKGLINKIKFLVSYPARFLQEYRCVQPADAITVVAPPMRENISEFFHVSIRKIHVVYNGFDDEILQGVDLKNDNNQVFTIGYFGKLMYYNQELTAMLFQAIEKINKESLRIRFLHIGPENRVIKEYFAKEGINKLGWYECVGQKEYVEGIRILSGCNVCALEYAYPEGPGTKVFDYIFLNKPVIGILKPGIYLERFLAQFDNAFVCHDKEEIENALQKILSEKIDSLINTNNAIEIINEFSRSKQNERFEELMVSVAHRGTNNE